MGFIRKLWRRHKVKAADRRIFGDQRLSSSHVEDDAPRMIHVINLREHDGL
jgi:hypothetical protein